MRPATDWAETIPGDEAARFASHARALRALQHARAGAGRASRALHAKGLAGVEARLTVLPDLPEHARVGLFAAPAEYRALVRFSNGSGLRQPDHKADVRGVAIKVLGVPGKKIIPGLEDARTQDFLLIRGAATPFRNADEFVGFVLDAASPLLLLPRMLARFGFGRTLKLLGQLKASVSQPVVSLATTRFFSALPIRFGPFAVHYALEPRETSARAAGKSPDRLGEELGARLRAGPVAYDLRVQFFRDEKLTPIEDGSVEWLEADAPFVTVGRLELVKQDTSSDGGRRVAAFVEELSFDPWHALEEHRPLGNMMRARKHAYLESTLERGARPEPDGTEKLDA